MADKARAAEKARELGAEYLKVYFGCAQVAFMAVLDALRSEGIEIISKEMQDTLAKGFTGFSGGVGNYGLGTCGAALGASAAVSLVAGVDLNENQIKANRWIAYWKVRHAVVDRFVETYGAQTCRDVQLAQSGKAYQMVSQVYHFGKPFHPDFTGRTEVFHYTECGVDDDPKEGTIATAAAWAAEAIIHQLENPLDGQAVIGQHEPKDMSWEGRTR
jgi:hypothetical protein